MRAIALALLVSYFVSAQQTVTTVPRLVRISSTFHPPNGQPPAPVEGVTLSIYRDEREGAPLWQETQNVSVDSEGRYSVLLGATLNDGLPMELFTSGEPRWLGVRFNRPGEVEQPRTLLTSVPYALRASDAETLRGLPASAFLRDPSVSSSPGVAAAASANLTPNAPKPRVTSGTAGFIGVFSDATDLGGSSMYQGFGTRIGLNTMVPLDYLHVAFNDGTGVFTGYAVQNLSAAGFSGMEFYDQNGALAQFQGFGNATHEYRINNIASNGTINFLIGSSSKFQVMNNGDINLAGNIRSGGTPLLQLSQWGDSDIGLGILALASNTTGNSNTATGAYALNSNTTGSFNTASGALALENNTTGEDNTASGNGALQSNTTGASNSATGNHALNSNTTGNLNTADGDGALFANTTGSGNTADGARALNLNTTGYSNTVTGVAALSENTTGANNTAAGVDALVNSTGGDDNTAIAEGALYFNTNGSNNIALGYQAALNVSGGNSNNIHIGSVGASYDIGAIRIGGNSVLGDTAIQTSFFAAGIRGITTGNNDAVPVVIDSNGQLGTVSSSRRYKEDIQDMGDASRGLMQLRPVTFRYQKPFADGSKPLQYGLIAEEVADVYPDLVARSADGQIETVKYQVLDSMLLNEVQNLQRQVDELRAVISHLTGGSK